MLVVVCVRVCICVCGRVCVWREHCGKSPPARVFVFQLQAYLCLYCIVRSLCVDVTVFVTYLTNLSVCACACVCRITVGLWYLSSIRYDVCDCVCALHP